MKHLFVLCLVACLVIFQVNKVEAGSTDPPPTQIGEPIPSPPYDDIDVWELSSFSDEDKYLAPWESGQRDLLCWGKGKEDNQEDEEENNIC